MPAWPTFLIRAAILLAPALFFTVSTGAQFSKLDNLASEIAKEVKPLEPHLIAVADFRSLDGNSATQGHYLAWMLSEALQEHGKGKFRVAEHKSFDVDLAKLDIPTAAMVPGDAYQPVAAQVGADILITGTVRKRDNSYIVQITPAHIADGKTLATSAQTVLESEFLDSLVTPFPDDILTGGRDRVSVPACRSCPHPSYTRVARSEQIQGVSVLMVLIAANGEPQQIRPRRFLGYGLDEQAYYAIKKWKFRPATKDGTRVASLIPIEITFRLY